MKFRLFIFLIFFNILFADENKTLESTDLDVAKEYFYNEDYKKSYEIFNRLFLNDLENPEINYYLAKSAIKLEKFGLANAAFDRILIKNYNNYLVRFEQAKLFYIQKNKMMAIFNIEELLNEDIPKDLEKEIIAFLNFTKKDKKLSNLEATLLFSLNRTDNANSSPNDKYILPNFQYLGEQGSSKVMDTYHIQLVNLSFTNGFESIDYLRIKNSLTYFNKTFMNEKKENFELYSYKPAIEILNDNSIFYLGTSFDRYQPGNLNSDDYFDAVGFESGYYFSKYAFDLNAYRFFYRNENYDDKNYTKYQARFRVFDLMGFDYSSRFYKDISFKSNRSDIDKISLENILSYNQNFTKTLTLTPSFTYKLINFEDESIAFNSRRKDSLKEYKVELKKDLQELGMLNLYLSYSDNDSNHIEYDNTARNIGIIYIKNFKW